MGRKKQHPNSDKKFKIFIKNLLFTTDDKNCWQEFECTKTSKCFAFLTEILKFGRSIITSEKQFLIFFWCNCFFLQNGSFHSSTTSERVLMRLHRFSEIRSASFTIKLHLWCHQSFSKQKLDVWSPNQTRKPKIQLFHGILHVSFSKGAVCYNFQNSDAVTSSCVREPLQNQ